MPIHGDMQMKNGFFVGCILMLMACNQDPYKIRTPLSDGWMSDSGGQDQMILSDFKINDSRVGDGDAARPWPDMSMDACLAMPEVCNNIDDNCNNKIDEDLDKKNDIRYCENCKGCLDLLKKNAYPTCSNGTCVIKACATGYIDQDKKTDNGCEYACTPTGSEVCDGIDNDCDKKIDEDVKAPPIVCKSQGPCSTATATCKGTLGWQCNYGPNVELQPCTKDEDCGSGFKCVNKVCPGVVIVNETLCDGNDGDCDGLADDPWKAPGLATAIGNDCDPTNKKGICRDQGKYVCDPVNKDKTICQLTVPGKSATTEKCNGLDDNCDGKVDNNVVDEEWVTVGSFKIFRYEASRPDATSQNAGVIPDGHPCSVPNRLPWASLTKEDAQAACKRIGARLCITADWEKACRSEDQTFLYPYGKTFDAKKCNGREYDSSKDAVLPTNQPSSCTSKWGSQTIFDMSGNVKEWTATAFNGSGNPTAYEIKGGAYDTPSLNNFGAGLSCDYDLPAPPSTLLYPTIGFRCCK